MKFISQLFETVPGKTKRYYRVWLLLFVAQAAVYVALIIHIRMAAHAEPLYFLLFPLWLFGFIICIAGVRANIAGLSGAGEDERS